MTSSLKFKVAYGVVLNFLRTLKLGVFLPFKNLVVSIHLKNVDFSNSSMSFGIETVLMSSIKKVNFFCCWPQVRKIREIALKHQSSFLATLNSKFLCLSRKNFNFKTLAKVCIAELCSTIWDLKSRPKLSFIRYLGSLLVFCNPRLPSIRPLCEFFILVNSDFHHIGNRSNY